MHDRMNQQSDISDLIAGYEEIARLAGRWILTEPIKPKPSSSSDGRIRIATIDLDGTLSAYQTGAMLVAYLLFHGYVQAADVPRLVVWGAGYLLSRNEDLAVSREMLFKRLSKKSAADADAVFERFYRRHARSGFRRDAFPVISALRRIGIEVVLVSGAFSQIVERAASDAGIGAWIGVDMEKAVDEDGVVRYTGRVSQDSPICEGAGKLEMLRRYANARYGEGNWTLTAAYGDHLSDRHLLEASENPVSVDGEALHIYAQRRGWETVRWSRKTVPVSELPGARTRRAAASDVHEPKAVTTLSDAARCALRFPNGPGDASATGLIAATTVEDVPSL